MYRLRIPALSSMWVHVQGKTAEKAKERYIKGLEEQNPKVMWDDPNVKWEIQRVEVDRCAYCEKHYHPMPVYVNPKGGRIWVCHYDFFNEKGEYEFKENFECREKAKYHGYEYRPDLTPRR